MPSKFSRLALLLIVFLWGLAAACTVAEDPGPAPSSRPEPGVASEEPNALPTSDAPRAGELEALRRAGMFAERRASYDDTGNGRFREGVLESARLNTARASLRAEGKSELEIAAALPAPPVARRNLATKGVVKTLTLLIDFADQRASSFVPGLTASGIEQNLYGPGTVAAQAYFPLESLNAYYKRASLEQLDIRGRVLDWYHFPLNRSVYEPTDGSSTAKNRALFAMVREAMLAQDATVDFSEYDNDGDGYLDGLNIVWSGPDTGWQSFWWAYQWEFFVSEAQNQTFDGVKLRRFTWQWVNTRGTTSNYDPIVLVHETGHLLGLPDYYDYTSSDGNRGGIGGDDMMDDNRGNHNAFSRWVLDWISPSVVGFGVPRPVSLRASGSDTKAPWETWALALWPGGATEPFSEFFLVENRTRIGNDGSTRRPLQADGLVIWHVDGTIRSGRDYAYDNSATAHKLLRRVQADGLDEIEKTSASCNAGDYFVRGKVFSPTTNPPSQRADGTRSNVVVRNISSTGATMTADVGFEEPSPCTGSTTTSTTSFTGPSVGIVDNSPSGVDAPLAVTSGGSVVVKVTVTARVVHPYTGDLALSLVGPDGTSVMLGSGVGEGGAGLVDTVFDDDAANMFSLGNSPFTGAYRPQESLSKFFGHPARGTWKLHAVDSEARDVGQIERWSLQILSANAPPLVCDPNATCSVADGIPSCACRPGFVGTGTACVPAACATNNGGCSANAVCGTDSTGNITCACKANYVGDGVTCVATGSCASSNGGCSTMAVCSNLPNARSCACNPGFAGTGLVCEDIDECAIGNGGCSENATCTNTPGSRTCTCKTGYAGSGVACADIDECLTDNGGCSENATCTNTPGSRTCTCKPGYEGDGVTCADIDECAVGNGGCSESATCTNTPGSRTCTCKPGFSGSGVACADIDECLTDNGGCSVNATCTNTPGGRTCSCKTGYAGSGVACEDIDECATDNGGCSENETCTNTVGSRGCVCKPGFVRDGGACIAEAPPRSDPDPQPDSKEVPSPPPEGAGKAAPPPLSSSLPPPPAPSAGPSVASGVPAAPSSEASSCMMHPRHAGSGDARYAALGVLALAQARRRNRIRFPSKNRAGLSN
jgi:M6 family metalloprotease-like protein